VQPEEESRFARRRGEEDDEPLCLDMTDVLSRTRIRHEIRLGHHEGHRRTAFRCEERGRGVRFV
jgi:hypothetical protein